MNAIPKIDTPTPQKRSLQSLAREYGPTMPCEVLHLWAIDVVAALAPLAAPVAPQPPVYVTHDDFSFEDIPKRVTHASTWPTVTLVPTDATGSVANLVGDFDGGDYEGGLLP